ncbi:MULTISPECIES: transposase [unclassified Xanthomonas]|uniref:transposase n=1 Tax=unclassified Xanthomonas TaxID=2643310 RepID=UPI002B235021|nr:MULTISPECIES: transposase [unclassified Xanthomonas]MEA9563432.1 transposase [Xanthomonas sp. WHRI 8932A]MEA9634424.1 transposase [Xanthomonas sp. WHRI 8812E]
MVRLARIDLPGIPQHIVQRGNNRLPCFLDDGDRLRYLHLLHEALHATGCQLHAYVLMDNHVHLLATPPATGRIGQLMQRLGRNYVALFNGRHGRTGTLWEGRYKACLVDSADYVFRCYRYIELNPVRAHLTDDPATYRWSSCPANLGQRGHSALTPHPCWLALGTDSIERSYAYRALLDQAPSDELLASIRLHLQQQRAPGHDAFRAMIEAWTRRFGASGLLIGHGSQALSTDK